MRFAPLLMLALLATSCVAFGSGKNDEFSKAKCVIPVRKVLGNFIDTVKVNKEAKDTSVPDFLHVPNKCLRTFFDEVVKQNLGAENLLALHDINTLDLVKEWCTQAQYDKFYKPDVALEVNIDGRKTRPALKAAMELDPSHPNKASDCAAAQSSALNALNTNMNDLYTNAIKRPSVFNELVDHCCKCGDQCTDRAWAFTFEHKKGDGILQKISDSAHNAKKNLKALFAQMKNSEFGQATGKLVASFNVAEYKAKRSAAKQQSSSSKDESVKKL